MIPTIPIAPLALHSGPHDVVGEARSEQPAASIERDGETDVMFDILSGGMDSEFAGLFYFTRR